MKGSSWPQEEDTWQQSQPGAVSSGAGHRNLRGLHCRRLLPPPEAARTGACCLSSGQLHQ